MVLLIFLMIFLIAGMVLVSIDSIICNFLFVFMLIGLVVSAICLRKYFLHMEDDNIYHRNNDNTDNIFR